MIRGGKFGGGGGGTTSPLLQQDVLITHQQLVSLTNNPNTAIELIPAQGANKAIVPVHASVMFKTLSGYVASIDGGDIIFSSMTKSGANKSPYFTYNNSTDYWLNPIDYLLTLAYSNNQLIPAENANFFSRDFSRRLMLNDPLILLGNSSAAGDPYQGIIDTYSITNPGTGYAVGQEVTVNSSYVNNANGMVGACCFRVTEVDGGGGVTAVELYRNDGRALTGSRGVSYVAAFNSVSPTGTDLTFNIISAKGGNSEIVLSIIYYVVDGPNVA